MQSYPVQFARARYPDVFINVYACIPIFIIISFSKSINSCVSLVHKTIHTRLSIKAIIHICTLSPQTHFHIQNTFTPTRACVHAYIHSHNID